MVIQVIMQKKTRSAINQHLQVRLINIKDVARHDKNTYNDLGLNT